ncbi:hypothetical protein Pyn_06928 [Prunus yedoensis var. nudiflora]|uniref:Uncharacterized protein n=1 Tax=Prunus yedoensis var. nudiflora TaxID=2094558 RepID=A0A315AIP1_PRUYE|nr:hypothetical protein Pyn_06928 [Prunus yedoensis var. nudiflora]
MPGSVPSSELTQLHSRWLLGKALSRLRAAGKLHSTTAADIRIAPAIIIPAGKPIFAGLGQNQTKKPMTTIMEITTKDLRAQSFQEQTSSCCFLKH